MDEQEEIAAQDDEITEMRTGSWFQDSSRNRIIAIVIAVALAVISAFPIASYEASPDAHATDIQSLDKKAGDVTLMVTAATTTAGVISLIPNGVGAPLASKLLDICTDFLVVLAAIFLEKYLLTIFGLAGFRILIPLACACFVFGVLMWKKSLKQAAAFGLALKLLLFGIAIALVIPASIFASNMIENTYSSDINNAVVSTTAVAENNAASTGTEAPSSDAQNANQDNVAEQTAATDPLSAFVSWVSDIGAQTTDAASDALSAVSDGVKNTIDQAKHALNNLLEALAVMIVVDCVIPVLVLVFFVWIVNTLFGVAIKLPGLSGAKRLAAPRQEQK